jgi:VWFA-related protein
MAVFCASLPVVAQQNAASEGPQLPPSVHATDRQIKLDVVVTDRSGKVVPGLQQHDFTILDNKKPTPILSFHAEDGAALTPDAAVEVILVVDEVNTGFQRIAYERGEIKKFLQNDGGMLAHPVSLIFFTDTGTEMQNAPTRDGNALLAVFDSHVTKLRTIRRSTGFYGAQERLQLSLSTLNSLAAAEAAKPGRKMMIWISPGWPMMSGPRIDLTASEESGIFNSVVNVSTALRKARITLYNVNPLGVEESVGRTTYYQDFLKGVTKPSDVSAGDLALQVITTQTGGLVIFGSNSIFAGVQRCVADADAFYVLTIEAAPSDKPSEYHSLQVKVETPGLTARTRTLYYAQP